MRRIALFDLDNTLIDRQAAFRRWAAAFLETRGLDEDDVDWLVRADDDGYASRVDLFAQLRRRYRLTQSVEGLRSDYERDYPLFFEPDPAVCGALEKLRSAGWRIAIVTNGPATQHVKIARAGLVDLIDACCVSDEIRSQKPDRRIFEHAVAACRRHGGVGPPGTDGLPEDTWMIGDSPEHDMVGARALGIRTVWIHRHRPWPIDGFEPDHRAASVPDAVTILLRETPAVGA